MEKDGWLVGSGPAQEVGVGILGQEAVQLKIKMKRMERAREGTRVRFQH